MEAERGNWSSCREMIEIWSRLMVFNLGNTLHNQLWRFLKILMSSIYPRPIKSGYLEAGPGIGIFKILKGNSIVQQG